MVMSLAALPESRVARPDRQEKSGEEANSLPAGWRYAYVEEIAQVTTGSRNTQDRLDDGAFPFFVRSQSVERISSYSFDTEAVLTAGDGVGTGKVFHHISGKFDAHQRVYVVKDFSACVRGYYFYLAFKSGFYNRIIQMTAKSSVDSVRREMITRMPIALPPIDEQDRIVQALKDADSYVQGLEKLLAKKRQVKQGVMQELLSGDRRLQGFTAPWEVAPISSIADIDPENLTSNTPANFSFNYVSLEDVDVGKLVGYSERVFEASPSRARRILRDNDVMFGTVRPNLQSHLLFKVPNNLPWVCSTGFCVIRAKEKIASPEFLFQILFSASVSKQIDALLAGSNYPSISNRDVGSLSIPVPSLDEQMAIGGVLADMDHELNVLEGMLAKAYQIKEGTMHDLLSGRIRLV